MIVKTNWISFHEVIDVINWCVENTPTALLANCKKSWFSKGLPPISILEVKNIKEFPYGDSLEGITHFNGDGGFALDVIFNNETDIGLFKKEFEWLL